MNMSRSTGVLLVGWGQGSRGLPFPSPLYYYQVDFHSFDHYSWERLMNRRKRIGVYWWVGDRVAGVYPSLTQSTIIK
jgi:hypothetical protein